MATELGSEPTVRTHLTILRQQRWWVIGTVLAGLGAGIAVSATQPRQYSATARVLIQSVTGSAASGTAAVTPTDVQTELELVTSAPVRQAVAHELGSAPAVSAAQVAQTNVLAITAASLRPAQSARIANAYARAFVSYHQAVSLSNLTAAEKQLRTQISAVRAQIRSLHARSSSPQVSALLNQEAVLREQLAQMQVSGATAGQGVELVAPAVAPVSPSSPSPAQDGLLGGAAGLLAGLAVAFLRNTLNDALTSKESVENLGGSPVLAAVPLVPSWKQRKHPLLVSDSAPASPAAEAYRSLRTSVQFARHEREIRTLVITSPAAAEGKTSTLANLGTVFAQASERVVLVSADLRRPRVGQFFGIDEDSGLTSVLAGQRPVEQVLQPVRGTRNLSVLPAGGLPHNPAELLSGPGMRDILARLREMFDLVLIDSPPVLPVTDAVVLSRAADATLLVVAAGQTRQGDLRRTAERMRQVDAPVIGIVLNEVTRQTSYGYGYGYGYGYKPYLPAAAETGGTAGSNGVKQGGNGKMSPADNIPQ